MLEAKSDRMSCESEGIWMSKWNRDLHAIHFVDLRSAHVTASRSDGARINCRRGGCLQSRNSGSPCDLHAIPSGSGEIVITRIMADERVRSIRVFQGIGESIDRMRGKQGYIEDCSRQEPEYSSGLQFLLRLTLARVYIHKTANFRKNVEAKQPREGIPLTRKSQRTAASCCKTDIVFKPHAMNSEKDTAVNHKNHLFQQVIWISDQAERFQEETQRSGRTANK